jgi:hypothetical protein
VPDDGFGCQPVDHVSNGDRAEATVTSRGSQKRNDEILRDGKTTVQSVEYEDPVPVNSRLPARMRTEVQNALPAGKQRDLMRSFLERRRGQSQ